MTIMKKRNLMIVGTMSGVGKSLITAGLCRIYTRRGYSVAPFKSQNMALNSYVTPDGGEIGTATALQALACGKQPSVEMNPILLKPTKDTASQVIINGEAHETLPASEYYKRKKDLMPVIKADYEKLEAENDIIFIEGAGSCAELNLRKDDIVNMGLATALEAPVVLVGDIDRGGIFAQLYGSVKLLPREEQQMIRALIVNKFRGDPSLFLDGVRIITEKTKKQVAGVLPYMRFELPEEDSLSERLANTGAGDVDIAVIRLPRISNYTDFLPLERYPEVSVRYVKSPEEFGDPDMVIVPGTKNTLGDLRWLKASGLDHKILGVQGRVPVMGICGGYQMLGNLVSDPYGVEEGGTEEGLGLIPMTTELEREKTTERVSGITYNFIQVSGYEIHAGKSHFTRKHKALIMGQNGLKTGFINEKKKVAGTYMHGFFDTAAVADTLVHELAVHKGVNIATHFERNQQEETLSELDRLADMMEENLDMDLIDTIIKG